MTDPRPAGSEPGSEPGSATGSPLAPVREQMRQQMLDGFGGWSGMVVSAVPTVVFVAVNASAALRTAVVAAVASALVLTVYRLIRHQPIQQALSGLLGVLVAAAIAGRTGQARGFFLLGIWSSVLYGAVFLVSILVRRPLVGAIWEFLDPTPAPAAATNRTEEAVGNRAADPVAGGPWHRRPHLARAYYYATAAGTAVFAARAGVQGSLFEHNSTGWLAVTRIAMGYPLTIAAAGFGWFVVRRGRRRLADEDPTDQHLTELHRTELHPTELHPTELHPTELHPTELHPTDQIGPADQDSAEHRADEHPGGTS